MAAEDDMCVDETQKSGENNENTAEIDIFTVEGNLTHINFAQAKNAKYRIYLLT